MLTVENVEARYGDVQVLFGISLSVGEKEIVGLVGGNGAGKSSTLRVISGLLKPSVGSVSFAGRRLDTLAPHDIVGLGLIQVPEGRRLFPQMTVQENLEMGAYRLGMTGPRARVRLDYVFEIFPRLRERRTQVTGSLSGGEQQMVALGRGLMAEPRLLLLDHPSIGLSPLFADMIMESIIQIRNLGTPILIVEQNVHDTLTISDRAYIMESGRILIDGPGSSLLQHDDVRRAYLGV